MLEQRMQLRADAIYSGVVNFLSQFDCDGVCWTTTMAYATRRSFRLRNPSAINFNNDATDEDGSCIEAVPGCATEGNAITTRSPTSTTKLRIRVVHRCLIAGLATTNPMPFTWRM